MALVVCVLIMYALWWNKPFGVERVVIVHASYNRDISATVAAFKQAGGPASNIAFSARSTDSSDIYLRAYFKRLLNRGIERGIPKRNLIYDMCVYMSIGAFVGEDDSRVEIRDLFGPSRRISIPPPFAISVTFYVAGTLFPAFHIGAWNWEFPTSTIRTIWRSFARCSYWYRSPCYHHKYHF
jgi:hypothetical protein